jgi:ABC-type branched-subunit amino acid transport system substrate-binding protein
LGISLTAAASVLRSGAAGHDDLAGPDLDSTRLSYSLVSVREPPVDRWTAATMEEHGRLEQDLRRLIRRFAEEDVVAIVAATTSQTSRAVIGAARAFDVPVLLAVATNPGLLGRGSEHVLRLLPSDARQANAISAWVEEGSSDDLVGVFYDPTTYGRGVLEAMGDRMGATRLLPFAFGSDSVVEALRFGEESGVERWVVVGYTQQASEVLSKARAVGVSGDFLITDGAFGTWLDDVTPCDPPVAIAFPRSAIQKSDNTNSPYSISVAVPDREGSAFELVGYSVYGYQAVVILDHALRHTDARWRPAERIATIRTAAAESLDIQFDESGENTTDDFTTVGLAECSHN